MSSTIHKTVLGVKRWYRESSQKKKQQHKITNCVGKRANIIFAKSYVSYYKYICYKHIYIYIYIYIYIFLLKLYMLYLSIYLSIYIDRYNIYIYIYIYIHIYNLINGTRSRTQFTKAGAAREGKTRGISSPFNVRHIPLFDLQGTTNTLRTTSLFNTSVRTGQKEWEDDKRFIYGKKQKNL